MSFYKHETALVDEGAEVDSGTKIWHFSHVSGGSKIGKNCSLGQNVFVAKGVKIGDGVKIQNNVSVYEGVVLEDYVFCGPSMVFTNVRTPRSAFPRNQAKDYHQTLVKKGASLGANCTVVCGVTIGESAFVGAGAVVTKNVPDFAMIAGVPGKIIGWACDCGIKIEFSGSVGKCPECSRKFKKTSDLEVVRQA